MEAREMYAECKKLKYTFGIKKKKGIKNFSIVQGFLTPEEKINLLFIGSYFAQPYIPICGVCAFAMTDNKIIVGRKGFFSRHSKIIDLSKFNDISLQQGAILSSIVFDTLKETFSIALHRKVAADIFQKMQSIVFANKNTSDVSSINISVADEINKLKTLLDDNVITINEFETQKRQLLTHNN